VKQDGFQDQSFLAAFFSDDSSARERADPFLTFLSRAIVLEVAP
jgi:hypothetical protein